MQVYSVDRLPIPFEFIIVKMNSQIKMLNFKSRYAKAGLEHTVAMQSLSVSVNLNSRNV